MEITPVLIKRRRFGSPIVWSLAGSFLILLIVAWISMPKLLSFYERRQGKRNASRAVETCEKGDYKSALLYAQKALKVDFNDPDATRAIANSLDGLKSPEAMLWRKRLAQLKPGDVPNAIAWAKDALKAKDPATAQQALRGIDAAAEKSPEYHDVCAAVALIKRDTKGAEAHLVEAARLDPAEDRYKLRLATMRLSSTEKGARAESLKTLEELRANPKIRLSALKVLMQDAAGQGDRERTRELASALENDPEATFKDGLLCLESLRLAGDPQFSSSLSRLQEAAAGKPDDLLALIAWMNDHNLAMMVSDWTKRLPADFISKPPLCVAVADSYARSEDWERLRSVAKSGDWGKGDLLRLAYLSQALKRSGDETGARDAWLKSLAAAKQRPESIRALARLAIERRWDKEAEEALWAVAAAESPPRWALDALWNLALRRGETASLHKISQLRLLADPTNVDIRNDFAYLGLLTGNDEGNPGKLASELYQQNPGNIVVASTYGLLLHREGKTDEALRVLDAFKPDELRRPSVALYYGIFLAESGHAGKSRDYIEIAQEYPMLPEEEALLAQAQGLTQGGFKPASVRKFTESPRQIGEEKLKGEGF